MDIGVRAIVVAWRLLVVISSAGSVVPAAGAPLDGTAPRSIVLMIADGSGFAHMEAASHHATGEARGQVYWRFPTVLAMSTHPYGDDYDPLRAWHDAAWLGERATDSAAAITAMTTGVKTLNGRLNVTPDGQPLVTLVEALAATGRATGIVTSVQFAHATPAGFAISHPRRTDYAEIAAKILVDSRLDVVMGAGHPEFDDDGQPRAQPDHRFVGGPELWQALRMGTIGGDADGDGRPDPWLLLDSRQAVLDLSVAASPPRRVLVLPRVHRTLQSKRAGDPEAAPYATPFTPDIPDLAEMTLAALNVLGRHTAGFGLIIEGGAIDWAAHDRQPGRLIEEQQDFDRAVEVVVRWLDERDAWGHTLLIVTSDHECGHVCGPPDGTALPPIAGRGAGVLPDFEIVSAAHTNALVPFLARGAGADEVARLASRRDQVRGPYLDVSDLGAFLQRIARTPAASPWPPAASVSRAR